jgi:hypothetical protein
MSRGADAGCFVVIFDTERDAMQGTSITSLRDLVGGAARVCTCMLGSHRDVRVERGLDTFDASKHCIGQFDGRECPRLDEPRRLGESVRNVRCECDALFKHKAQCTNFGRDVRRFRFG